MATIPASTPRPTRARRCAHTVLGVPGVRPAVKCPRTDTTPVGLFLLCPEHATFDYESQPEPGCH